MKSDFSQAARLCGTRNRRPSVRPKLKDPAGLRVARRQTGTAKSPQGFLSSAWGAGLLQLEKIEVNQLPVTPEVTGEQYEFVLTWKNRGRTPATITRVGIGRAIAVSPPHTPMYHFFDGSTINATVGVGEEYLFRTTDPTAISPDQRKQIELGIAYQWIWGEIKFDDGAGTSCHLVCATQKDCPFNYYCTPS